MFKKIFLMLINNDITFTIKQKTATINKIVAVL